MEFSLQEPTHKLLSGLTLGHVYDMGTVWDLYLKIADENQTVVPGSFMSRRKTFHDATSLQLFRRELKTNLFMRLYQQDT